MCLEHSAPPIAGEPRPLPADLRLFDAHCHLAWEHCVPPPFIEGALDNLLAGASARGRRFSRSALLERMLAALQDPQADKLVAAMSGAQIDKSALLVPDMTYALKGSRFTIEELLRHHVDVAARHPGRFELFAGVDPRWGADGVALFERCVDEWGYRGLKVYPPCGFNPSDATMFPFYEICAARGLPVLVHIGPTSPTLSFSTSHPFLLEEAFRSFPSVKFILGHGAASYREECVMLCAFRPNVFLELSGIQAGGNLLATLARVGSIFQRGINHKVLFGSDFPVFQLPLRDFAASIFADSGPLANTSEQDVALIARGNFERLWDKSRS
jgi:uncharacterized protein